VCGGKGKGNHHFTSGREEKLRRRPPREKKDGVVQSSSPSPERPGGGKGRKGKSLSNLEGKRNAKYSPLYTLDGPKERGGGE